MKTFLISLLFVTSCYCQRIAQDAWNTRDGFLIKLDKLEHAAGSFLLYTNFRILGMGEKSFGNVLFLGLLWEIKDSLYDWETYGSWGGDGFSEKDLIANTVGILASALIWKYMIKR